MRDNFLRDNPLWRSKAGRVAIGIIVVVAAASTWMLTHNAKSESKVVAAAPLEFEAADVVRAGTRELARTLPLTGTLNPINQAVVKAKVAGEIRDLTVREGVAVRAGQVIGHIDVTDAQAQLAGRQADVEAARAQAQVAEKNRATQLALLERKFISQNAFDTTQGNYDVAKAKLKAADATADVARKALRDTTLAAPIRGMISERYAQAGERVPVDGKIVDVVDLSRLELTAPVPASDIAAVRKGQAVSFRVEGFGEREFVGRIDRINPAVAPGSRSMEIYAVIDNTDGSLKGGMFAQGKLVTGSLADALVVPASAVREERGEYYVYAIEGGKVLRRVVTVGARVDDLAQIATGLAPGATVVRHNLGSLREGTAATIKAAPVNPASATPPAAH